MSENPVPVLLRCVAVMALLILMASAFRPCSAGQTRIMPLGDSITEATAGHSSYRYWLWNYLAEAGYDVDFVGSQTGVSGGSPKFDNFDQDHEGHYGFFADEIAVNARQWVESALPDIVLLHIGTNDLWGSSDVKPTVREVADIIREIRAARPDVIVLVAQIIPAADEHLSMIPDFNSAIADLAANIDSGISPVVAVDQWTGFDVMADSYDGVHPNDSGEQKMADRWLSALTNLGERFKRSTLPKSNRQTGRATLVQMRGAESSSSGWLPRRGGEDCRISGLDGGRW